MVCGRIVISENVTLLSAEMICGTTVINKSVRDSYFFTTDLWHQQDQCECQSTARRVGYFQVVIRYSYIPFGKKNSLEYPQNSQKWQHISGAEFKPYP